MCKELATLEIKDIDGAQVNFRKLILTRCQREFEKGNEEQLAKDAKMKEINSCSEPVSMIFPCTLERNFFHVLTVKFFCVAGQKEGVAA